MENMSKGFIYVIEDVDRGLCKIGCSSEPDRRINQIVNGSCIDNHNFFISNEVFNKYSAEREVHILLDSYRKKGEWFACPFDECVVELKSVAENHKPTRELEDIYNSKTEVALEGFKESMRYVQKLRDDESKEEIEKLLKKQMELLISTWYCVAEHPVPLNEGMIFTIYDNSDDYYFIARIRNGLLLREDTDEELTQEGNLFWRLSLEPNIFA